MTTHELTDCPRSRTTATRRIVEWLNEHYDAPERKAVVSRRSLEWLATPVLKVACSALGGVSGWMMRIKDGRCEVLASAGAAVPGDWELGQMASCQHFFEGMEQIAVSYRGGQTMLCAGLTPAASDDRSFFALGVLFEGTFRMTERSTGLLEGFRGSLQVMIDRKLELKAMADRLYGDDVEAACACCRRLKTREYGWLHWDDHRFLAFGRPTSHTVCESCAVAIYGQECMNEILSEDSATRLVQRG